MRVITKYRLGGILFTLFVGVGTLLLALQGRQPIERELGYLLILGAIAYIPAGMSFGTLCAIPGRYRFPAVCLYLIQLALQCIWYPLLLSDTNFDLASIWLLVLCGICAVTFGFFYKVEHYAAYIFVGYCGWLILLTAYIWIIR